MIAKFINKLTANLGYEVTIHPIKHHAATPSEKGLVYVHIPKCGGMSIDEALRKQLACVGERKIKRQPLLATNLATFNREIHSLDDACDFSEYHASENKKILRYHLNQNWHYVSGHLTVDSNIINDFKNRYQFATVLREPVSRFISNYLYNKMTNVSTIMLPNNTSHLTVDSAINEAKEILSNRRGWHMANTLALFITGQYPKNESDATQLQVLFTKNITQFAAVGFLSNLEGFCHKVKKVAGVNIDISRKNTAKSHHDKYNSLVYDTLREFFNESKIQKQLTTLCKHDIENYNFALNKYGN